MSEHKCVTFFNMSASTVIRYSGKILEPPASVDIQLVDTREHSITHQTITATLRNDIGGGGAAAHSKAEYAEVLERTRTFVIADRCFFDQKFLTHGLEPLVDFYRGGGRVVVFCSEGSFGIAEKLNEVFGCEWEVGTIDRFYCEPTPQAVDMLGELVCEKIYASKGHFMLVPEHEILFRIKKISKEDYVQDRFGLSYEELSQEEKDESEADHAKLLTQMHNSAVLAMHK
eukprot:CAMPEP_0206222786 /NCGR_PEP_ID=MMETSP0047_2-20121206/6141_1 /ASSEMBLY_ACC=CAM_ASM_000192 /TAXON_ID=195065 /ORGANISM="Chroomonas mesostigmatica_cf, Strain CCMP1168" /LENGTH=228 /DNA_ID=CAMNT_0053645625 /DNA_START=157 /DNA_END=840 /DNA_ORIENTATION=-